MVFIDGIQCNWRNNSLLKEKLNLVLVELESAGVRHHDLRPENILLSRSGDIKVIDFGLAEIIC